MTLKQAGVTSTEVINGGAFALTDGEIAGGQTEFDNSTNGHTLGVLVINAADSFSAAPAGPIEVYMIRNDIEGTQEGTALGGGSALTGNSNQTDIEYAEYVGSFFPTVDEAYIDHLTISLLGVLKAKFYIKNNTGVTMDYTANPIIVDLVPISLADV